LLKAAKPESAVWIAEIMRHLHSVEANSEEGTEEWEGKPDWSDHRLCGS
jgi:hypothetical protein